MSYVRRSTLRPMSQINVVPYIDVMLVLLVIFMITAPLMNPGQIDLPSVGKSAAPPVAPLEVVINKNNSLAVRDLGRGGLELEVSREELITYVKEQQRRHPGQPVVISADKDVRYQEVVGVMDLLQREQVRKVGLLVKVQ